MDSALKQRLLGATVLIVLAVIFVPMLLDGPRAPGSTQTVDLSMPAEPGRDFETQVVPLTPPGQPPVVAATPDTSGDQIATVDTQAPPRPDAFAGTANAPVATTEPAQTPTPTPDTAVTPPPPAPTPTPVEPKPAPNSPSTHSQITDAVTQSPAPVSEALPATTARGRYAVNFGSYGKVDNANALVAELKRAGIEAHTERVDLNGQAGLRVRAGPYVDRAQAERVRLAAKRARANLSASVVEIDDSPRADVPAAAVGATATGWAVQVGAFQAEADAKARRDKLRSAGFTAFTDTVRAEKGTLYRVRVGPEAQRANAERLRDALKARLQIDGIVVPHP